jgi:ubiquinone biosynthesis monooxygenase Coq7
MYDQEQVHLEYFEAMIKQYQVRPTALMPLWKWVGRAAGSASAFLGPKATMACTEAVEDVIDHHYAEQINQLEKNHPEEIGLINSLKTFREDECNHRNTASEYNQDPSMVKNVIKEIIKLGVKTAIKISQRI